MYYYKIIISSHERGFFAFKEPLDPLPEDYEEITEEEYIEGTRIPFEEGGE